MCDYCCTSSTHANPLDVNPSAAALLGFLQSSESVQKKVTLIQLIEAWRSSGKVGSAASAAAKAMTREDNEAVVAHMLMGGLLQLDFAHTAYATNVYLRCSDTGAHRLEAFARRLSQAGSSNGSSNSSAQGSSSRVPDLCAPVHLVQAQPGNKPPASPDHSGEAQVIAELLGNWRLETAARNNVFPQSVLPDEHMQALSTSRDPLPTTLAGLAACLGGLSRNGGEQALLQLLQSHVRSTGGEHNRNQAGGSSSHPDARSVPALADGTFLGETDGHLHKTGRNAANRATTGQSKRQSLVLDEGDLSEEAPKARRKG